LLKIEKAGRHLIIIIIIESEWTRMSQISSVDVQQVTEPLEKTPETAQVGQSTANSGQSLNPYPSDNFVSCYGPQPQFQLNIQRIYEREFFGGAYISAHLERVQRGVYKLYHQVGHEKQHQEGFDVVLVALRFVCHPCDSSIHRIKSAVITINLSASGSGPQPKILKYAPHLAYGRISSSDLTWQFQLGASLGVSQPAQATVNPQGSVEKHVVLQSMMTIQGSSRTSAKKDNLAGVDIEDGKMVWSLEENKQQKSGIPREFTFVFLLNQPRNEDQAKYREIDVSLDIRPSIAWSFNLNRKPQRCVLDKEIGQSFVGYVEETRHGKSAIAPAKFNFASLDNLEDLIELPGSVRKSQNQGGLSR
jgi:hypothetical protein